MGDPYLVQYGMDRQTAYCPSGDFQNSDDLWNYSGGFSVTGYYWLMGWLSYGPFGTNRPIFMGYPEQYDDSGRP